MISCVTSLKSFTCDLTKLHRGTVSNLIRASVKVHRSVVAVSMGRKSSASSARNLSSLSSGLLQTAQTWANAGVCGGLCACAVGGTFD